MCALVALSVSGVVAEVDEDEWNEEGHQLTLGFMNEGVDDSFLDLSYQSEGDDNDSEIFLERLTSGMDYNEDTYFGHEFILRSDVFSVKVRVEENEDVDDEESPGAGFPYSITFNNLAETDASFRIDEDAEVIVAGDSTTHFTRDEWRHIIYGPNDTPIASIEIFPNFHDEL